MKEIFTCLIIGDHKCKNESFNHNKYIKVIDVGIRV